MLTGRRIDADEAERIGLVTSVVPDEELAGAALDVADQIATNSPLGVRLTKHTMWSDASDTLAGAVELETRGQILSLLSPNAKEQMAAMAERRLPEFAPE
jgi:enoyl-CoA hydratase